MRKAIALLVGTLLPLLGFSEIGQAQSSVQVEGTIEAVDCQAQTLVLSTPGTSNTVAVAPYTAVLVNSTSVPFCSLQQYLGAEATAWLLANGNEFVATRIDVVAGVAAVPPAPAVVVAPLPIVGIVLGTIVVAGLAFLLVRDYDGHYYRYPYYGPYHRYYYRPEYRPYRGSYPYAPVREGDRRWDAPPYRNGRSSGGPGYYGPVTRRPVQQGTPPRWTPPGNRYTPAYRYPNRYPNGNPRVYPNDRRQTVPAYRSPTRSPRMYPNDRRRDAPRYYPFSERCDGRGGQSCGRGSSR
jgi:hypothetical protein